jgi:DNA polymerase sigma
VAFEIETSPCFETQLITIEEAPSGKILKQIEVKDSQQIKLELDYGDVYSKRILFSTDADVCKIDGDPRGLYFNLKNLKYETVS